jgi:hypothetical protein
MDDPRRSVSRELYPFYSCGDATTPKMPVVAMCRLMHCSKVPQSIASAEGLSVLRAEWPLI